VTEESEKSEKISGGRERSEKTREKGEKKREKK
jgi:hypothetical protein